MIVSLNGRRAELPEGASVADAVAAAGVGDATRGVAVAVDGQVIRRVEWKATRLERNQVVEVLHAVQGG
jgi:sulfur carrier protein